MLRRITVPLCFTVASVPLLFANAFAADAYIEDIAPLDGQVSTRAYGINNYGVVVLKSYTINDDDDTTIDDGIPVIWDTVKGNRSLPKLDDTREGGVWAITDDGYVTGFSLDADDEKHAVLWQDDGTLIQIGPLENPNTGVAGEESGSYGISSDHVVVGYSYIPNDAGTFIPFHGTYYDGDLTDIGTLNTTYPTYLYGYSYAYAINDSHVVVGVAYNDSNGYSAFVYSKDSGMTALQIDATYSSNDWYAACINNTGMIAGHVIIADGHSKPYVWVDQNSAPVAIEMPAEYPYGEVYNSNEQGQLVGLMWNDADEEHGFLYDPQNGVVDLNDLLPDGSGWEIENAFDINEHGQISGSGSYQGETRGYLLNISGRDSDGDGIDDNWEYACVADLTTLSEQGDYDGDGYDDLEEFELSEDGAIDRDGNSYDPTVFNSGGHDELWLFLRAILAVKR